ncbi:MAG: chloride channel protein, partial [Rhodospirillaceae bacterium]|nr:chloride channel protein [Rhodospirillaceae bacterium]
MRPYYSMLRFLVSARRIVKNDQLILAVLALVVGVLAGVVVIGFREGIAFFQNAFYGTSSERLYQFVQTLQWWQVLWPPVVGGLIVGILVRIGLPEERPQGVADVIEASALKGGRMSLTTGLRAALINAISIGAGASVGREGPAVHLGAALAASISKRLHLTRSLSRTL